MITETKLNPIETFLLANGYVLQPKLNEYAKPRYRKGDNEIIVCWGCGFVIINEVRTRFSSYTFDKKLLKLIP